jgi:hypothetical protein
MFCLGLDGLDELTCVVNTLTKFFACVGMCGSLIETFDNGCNI